MDSLNSVLDPSDWLNTKLPPLYQLDSMIRCHICKEFMSSPVLTGCGHCFCSLCIRSTLASIGKCPLCNEEQFESNLRKNLILEEVVVFFKKHRQDLMEALKVENVNEIAKGDDDITEINTPELISLDSDDDNESDKNFKRNSLDVSSSSIRKRQKRPLTVTEQIAQSQKETVKSENLSECPICHEFLPLTEIETTHIDICLKNNGATDEVKRADNEVKPEKKSVKKSTLSRFFVEKPSKSKTTSFDMKKQFQIQNHSTTNNRPLKKLNFSSLNTTKLKEKLSLLSIPTTGSRQQLEARYNQYVILYNSNLDSINPVPLQKLRASLNQWEFLNNNMDTNLQVTTIQKNVDRGHWVETYNDEFKKLIAKARGNSKDVTPSTSPQEISTSEEKQPPASESKVGSSAGSDPESSLAGNNESEL